MRLPPLQSQTNLYPLLTHELTMPTHTLMHISTNTARLTTVIMTKNKTNQQMNKTKEHKDEVPVGETEVPAPPGGVLLSLV